MQTRKLGRHDLELSVLGFGGIVVAGRDQPDADAEVARAFDRGINYFDVAPQYGDAQQILGPALRPYRDQVTLACKTLERTAAKAAAELDDSLAKLKTDHFDIYQLHSMTTVEDFETAMGPGGVFETVLKAREQGKIRYVGFSAHNQDIAVRLIETDQFDTMLVPLNYVVWTHGKFGPKMLEAANQRGMGVMALKAMARAKIQEGEDRSYKKCWYHPEDRPEVAGLLLRYTLNLPGVAAAIPPGDPSLFHLACDQIEQHGSAPLTDDEMQTLAAELADAPPIFASA